MGIFDTIKGIFVTSTPKTEKVSGSTSVSEKDGPIFESNQSVKDSNTDTVQVNKRTREQIYKQIEDLCAEYRMSLEDVKKANLLEQVAGCTTEELLQKSDEEIKTYIEPLKHSLKWLSWKLPWQERNIDDINRIAKNANERYIYLQTGRSFLGNLFRNSADLKERLADEGLELNKDGVKAYFDKIISEAVASGDAEKIKEAYNDALIKFGDLLNDTEDAAQKELLTAGISKLEAGKRALASRLSIASCRNITETVQATARGLAQNYVDITCTPDALGEYTSNDDNIEISQQSFSHMAENDVLLTLNSMKARRLEIEAKRQRGETLTDTEQRYHDSVQLAQYAGAVTGTMNNSYIENTNSVLSVINNDTTELGIQREVYNIVSKYIESHPESINLTPEALTRKMDEITGGKYSELKGSSIKTSEQIDIQSNTTTTTNHREQTSKSTSVQQQTAASKETKHKQQEVSTTSPSIKENISLQKVTTKAAQQDQNTDKKAPVISSQLSNAEYKEYTKENGTFKTIVDTFNNLQYVNSSNINTAARMYSNLTDSRQSDILKRVNNAGLNELLSYTSDTTLVNLQGETFSNFYATKRVNEAAKEVEEKHA